MSLCTAWNVSIRKLYGLPVQTHCRYLMHISQQNVDHELIVNCKYYRSNKSVSEF